MMGRAVAAEWIKFFTVRAPRLLLILVLVGCVAVSVLIGTLMRVTDTPADADDTLLLALAPMLGFQLTPGAVIPLSAVIGVLAVTTEHRFGTIRATFLAVPNRARALVAKTAVTAGVCAAAALIGAGLSVAGYLLGGGRGASAFGADAGVWIALPVVAALFAVIGIAVGTVIRNAAGAIALLLGYLFVVESVVWAVGRLRPAGPFLPLSNAQKLLGVGGLPMHWNAVGALVYLLVFTGVLWAGAAAILSRRDA